MDQRRYRFALWTIPVVFVGVFLALLNAQYPLIGQDYFYFFPRILSGTWHFAHAGFVPFRYDPHFCGGLGHYGNPQDVSFSMLQLFGMTTDLWTAVQVTLSLMILAGYIGWYRVGRDVMALNNEWSHALATITSASGYYILHMVLGHMTFHTTTLLGWFVWLVFADAALLTSWKTRAALTALLSAFILHAGGYFVLMQCALLIALMLPFVLALHEAPLARAKELAMRLGIMGVAALLACASKLVAIASYMQIFPRTLPFYPYVGDDPIPLFVAKALWMIPQHLFAFGTQPYAAGLHEFSMQISPVTLLGVIALPFFLWHTRAGIKKSGWILIAAGTAATAIITYGFVKGDGATADLFQRLPILSSWRMNMRFLYVTSVLVAIGGTFGFAWLAKRRLSESRAAAVAIGSSILTIIAFYGAHSAMISPKYLDLQMPYDQVRAAVESSGYLEKSVVFAEDYRGQQISDMQYILAGTTGTTCYEILLSNIDFLPILASAPTDTVVDGSFNMINPACLHYPDANNCEPGALISATDDDNFQRFIDGRQPRWKLPWWQRAADIATLLMLVACIGWVGWDYKKRVRIRTEESHKRL